MNLKKSWQMFFFIYIEKQLKIVQITNMQRIYRNKKTILRDKIPLVKILTIITILCLFLLDFPIHSQTCMGNNPPPTPAPPVIMASSKDCFRHQTSPLQPFFPSPPPSSLPHLINYLQWPLLVCLRKVVSPSTTM